MIVVLVCLSMGLILTGIASWLVEMSCKIESKSGRCHKHPHGKNPKSKNPLKKSA